MVTVNHHCQFCGVPVVLRIADGAENLFTIEKWKSFAACNRCSDFLERRRRAYQNLEHAAIVYRQDIDIILSKLANSPTQKDKEKWRGKLEHLRAEFEKKVKAWLSTMNLFFKTNVSWDSTVMDHLSDKSVAIGPILAGCERMIRQNTSIPALGIGQAKFPSP